MKTLYKLSATKTMMQWSISGILERSEITITYGHVGGAMQTQIDKVVTNNSGRSLKEQILLEIKSRISRQLAKGYRVSPQEAMLHINKNELDLDRPMLALQFDKVRYFDPIKAFRQFKYDGHRCLMTCQDGEILAYSRNGKIMDTLDHIKEGMQLAEGETVDGEVYCHGYPLQTIASWCKREQPNTSRLRYMVYDTILPVPYSKRFEKIKSMNLGPCTEIAETWQTSRPVEEDLKMSIARGYEGLMLRCGDLGYDSGKRSSSLIKVKEALDDEFQVIGIDESADGWAILVCKTSQGKEFRVSAPGSMDNKRRILQSADKYIGEWIRVEYFSETIEGIPFHPVATIWRNKHGE